MLKESFWEAMTQALPHIAAKRDEPMRYHTSMRAGGKADCYLPLQTAQELAVAVSVCRKEGVPYLVMGNASNILFRDGGYRGAVLQWVDSGSIPRCEGETMEVSGGMLLSRAANFACHASLSGMECVSGIPGTVGGGTAINAGAYGGEMKDIVERVQVLPRDGGLFWVSAQDMDFGYRHSRAMEEGWIVTGVRLALRRAPQAEIRARMDELAKRRREKQPLEYPSCGSVFKRPAGYFAAALIEEAGLKGCRVGDAQVSPKHAGFIVNLGEATAAQLLQLIDMVRDRVYAHAGVRLELEIRVVGEEAPLA